MTLGRPARTLDSTNRSADIERLLVEGELVTDDEGNTTRAYPTSKEVAARLEVSPSWVSKYAKTNRCFERRAALQAKVAEKAQKKLVEAESKRVAYCTEKTLQLCDRVLEQYDKFVEENGVKSFSVTDLDKVVRLRRYLQGDADSRQEVTSTLTLETLQGQHRDFLRNLRETSDAECGIEAEEQPEKAPIRPFEEGNGGSKVDQEVDQKEADLNVH